MDKRQKGEVLRIPLSRREKSRHFLDLCSGDEFSPQEENAVTLNEGRGGEGSDN